MNLVPVTFAQACDFVADWHRHHYTQQGETGASLRAAGWSVVAERAPRAGWNAPTRARQPRGVDNTARTLWEATS